MIRSCERTVPGEAEVFYHAMLAKDRRFDGRFFVGVRTTGVYCRSICPAKKPKPGNVSFYPTAAAAEEAGFRPCVRCRPETAPGTPAWLGTSETVIRALQLIDGANLGPDGVESLSEQLGVTDRYLRKLFAEHVGAPPVAVSQIARLDFARRLIDETSLPVTQIAFASGFSSVRRFNDSFVKRFGKPPGLFRKERVLHNDPCFELTIPYRTPFDWESLVSFLRGRAICDLEACFENQYARTISIGGVSGYFIARHDKGSSCIRTTIFLKACSHLMYAVARIKSIFDLDADPLAIMTRLGHDKKLRYLVRRFPGLRVPGCWSGFELAVRAIVGQQVSVKAARTLLHRLVEKYGENVRLDGLEKLSLVFPTPEALSGENLVVDGIPSKRLASIQQLAKMVRDGEIDFNYRLSTETLGQKLMEIPGVGSWTAQYIAMRAVKDPDAFPSTDLVIKREMARLGSGFKRAEAWRPWRAYATMYLWKGFAEKGGS